MKPRSGSAIVLAALLTSCAPKAASPRVATAEEAAAILSPLIPRNTTLKSCVQPRLSAPLERLRQDKATEKAIAQQRPFWQRFVDWVESPFGQSRSEDPQNWRKSDRVKNIAVSASDAAQLSQLLQRAVDANLPNSQISLALPAGVNACDERDENTSGLDPTPVGRFYLSRPVIVGNVAFVETGVVCGPLCGTGGLVALMKRQNTWSVIASRMTWIS